MRSGMERERTGERGSALIVVLLITVLLLLLGVSLMATSETEMVIAANDHWSEGAFQAAEAAVQVTVDQLDVNNQSVVVNETEIGDSFVFRSGKREDTSAQPPAVLGVEPGSGYSVAESTGYAPSGYGFGIFQVNGTGNGPRNTEREVEVLVRLGPIAE